MTAKLREVRVGAHPTPCRHRRGWWIITHCCVTELRVTVPEETTERLASEAAERGTSAEHVAAEVPRLHALLRRGTRRFAFIGIGQARQGFSARQAEERLEAEGYV